MAAQVASKTNFAVTRVSRLFTPLGFLGGLGAGLYDVSPDGSRFLLLDRMDRADASGERLVVVQRFATVLAKEVPR